MSYTPPSNRSFHSAFQTRVRNNDTEIPPAFPGAFQGHSRKDDSKQERSSAFPDAFQQKKREYDQRSSGSAYRSWKESKDVPKSKPMDLQSKEDFPSLGGSSIVISKSNGAQVPSVSLAEKLKLVLQEEQEEAKQRRYQKESQKSEAPMISIPFSTHWQRKQLEKKEAFETKQREIEEEERNYRWNISSEITREDTLDNVEEYNTTHYDQEEDQTCYNHETDN